MVIWIFWPISGRGGQGFDFHDSNVILLMVMTIMTDKGKSTHWLNARSKLEVAKESDTNVKTCHHHLRCIVAIPISMIFGHYSVQRFNYEVSEEC